MTSRAFSRPVTMPSRVGGPVGSAVQRRTTERYRGSARTFGED